MSDANETGTSWNPLPEDWLEPTRDRPNGTSSAFWLHLRRNPDAKRLWATFLPRLPKPDRFDLFTIAALYAKDSKAVLRDRRERYRDPELDLQKLIRERKQELPPVWIPSRDDRDPLQSFFASPFARELYLLKRDEKELETVKYITAMRRYGRFQNLGHLYYIREILERKSGVYTRLKSKELGSIVAAAYYALGLKLPEEQESGENLFRQLRRFQNDNQPFVDAVAHRIDQSLGRSSSLPPDAKQPQS